MNQGKIYFLIFSFLFAIAFTACLKKPLDEDTPLSPCRIYATISSDTNYIPHKKGNSWNYCNGAGWNGWTGTITLDTVIGNKIRFTRMFDFQPGHSGAGAGSPMIGDGSFHFIVDNSGNYYFLKYINPYYVTPPGDTILIIKPSAITGDTIYNNSLTHVKVVLVDNNETFRSITGCYHSRVMLNADSTNIKIVDHYFKKGIGEIYFTENESSQILNNAIIH